MKGRAAGLALLALLALELGLADLHALARHDSAEAACALCMGLGKPALLLPADAPLSPDTSGGAGLVLAPVAEAPRAPSRDVTKSRAPPPVSPA